MMSSYCDQSCAGSVEVEDELEDICAECVYCVALVSRLACQSLLLNIHVLHNDHDYYCYTGGVDSFVVHNAGVVLLLQFPCGCSQCSVLRDLHDCLSKGLST